MKRILIIVLCIAMLAIGAACSKKGSTTGSDEANGTPVPTPTPELKTITGSMTIANYGKITFEVYPQYAPQSALNFVYLAQNGCFNGVIIDRIQKGITLEMGKYLQAYKLVEVPEGEYTIKGEFQENGVNNPLSVAKGMLVWSRDSKDPDSACNEFMICLDTARCQGLQNKYAPFGKITGGFVDGKEIDATKALKDLNKLAKKQDLDEYNRPKGDPIIVLVCQIDGDTVWPAPDMIRNNKSDKAN